MDLSSHLESQSFDKIEEESKIAEESHDLPDLPKAKKKLNRCGVGVSLCNGCAFFFSLCSTIITVSILLVENKKVVDFLHNHSPNITGGGCILTGKFDADNQNSLFIFEESLECPFTIFGTAGLAVLSILYMYGSCCRSVLSCMCGTTAFNFVSVLDFIVLLVCTLFGLSIGVMINIGRKNTCESAQKTHADSSVCTTDFVVNDDGKRYNFDAWMNVAEMSSWATACIFALMTIVNMFLMFGFCIKCFKSGGRRVDENELDAFNRNFEDDDDDQLLDPSQDTTATPSKLVFEGERNDHTSFPPYNTGVGEGGFYGDNPWNES